MKKLILILFLLSACGEQGTVALNQYKGCIVMDKMGEWVGAEDRMWKVKILQGDYIITLDITEYDYNKYNLGDTIK